MTYEREAIRRIAGYTSGEQPDDPATIKLNTNENPYPPSPAVAEALQRFDPAALRRYPQPTADAFRRLVAARTGLAIDSVLVANGGDEALRLAFTTFLDPGNVFVSTDPTYSLYAVLADIQGCSVVNVPLTDDWDLPRDFAKRANDAGARLVCLVCPHAPTGRLVAAERLSHIANELNGVLLVDEAYVDFVDPSLRHDTVNLARAFDNVLLLRTLSKGYSLAGLRLGYLLGSPGLIAPMLNKTRDSYNVDTLAQAIACAAFADLAYAERTWERVRAERRRLRDALAQRGWDVPVSQTNFLLATPPPGRNVTARTIYEELKRRAILVRYFATPRIEDKLRITIGDPEQNDRLLSALDEIVS